MYILKLNSLIYLLFKYNDNNAVESVEVVVAMVPAGRSRTGMHKLREVGRFLIRGPTHGAAVRATSCECLKEILRSDYGGVCVSS